MKKILTMALMALMTTAFFCQDLHAQVQEQQHQTRKEKKAEAKAIADSLALLEASIVDGVEMTFKFTDHNFGTREAGSDISYEFEFVNTGKNPLIISNVSTSCGCTTPDYSREPVPSKGRGKIHVKYDSNRIGSFSKSITVYSNAENSPVVLSIKGTVVVKQ
ncbi:MAG: DUF1573 domain-containing protein [Bacteroidales bacterium]|nr:DUF1573 domain-containing protein [Bacteroidales bacterium]